MPPVHQCPSELCQDHRESPAGLDLQGPRENRDHQEDPASLARTARMVSRENEAHLEKRVKKDLKELGSKAPEDHRDHLVRRSPSSSLPSECLTGLFLPPQGPRDREDPAAKVLQADRGIQDPPVGLESPDLLVLLDHQATATQTHVLVTTWEVHEAA